MRTKKSFWIILLVFGGICAFLFNVFYNEAKHAAIKNTNETQMVHARVTARGIQGYFETWIGMLDALSRVEAVADNTAEGKHLMKVLYDTHVHEITAITRVNEKGVIIYTTHNDKLIGRDISGDKHINTLLKNRKTLISDVFETPEGVKGIAVHVPIFKGTTFKGSVSILINYRNLTSHFLSEIKIGKTGHAWVVSRNGIELYSPNPDFIGKSMYENLKDFPSFIPMANEMLKGRQGYATYQYDRANGHKMKMSTKLAIYVPVRLRNTFWSIVVVTNEDEVLKGLVSFRNKLLIIIITFFVFGMIFIAYGTKGWLIMKEEEKRKKTEAQLIESEEKYRNIYDHALEGMYQISLDGEIIHCNYAMAKLLGFDSVHEFFDSETSLWHQLWINDNEKYDFLLKLERQKVVLEYESQCRRKNNEIIWISTNTRIVYDKDGKKLYYEGFALDITKRKENELTIQKKVEELQWYYDIAISRELKMVELKKEINELLKKMGKEGKY